MPDETTPAAAPDKRPSLTKRAVGIAAIATTVLAAGAIVAAVMTVPAMSKANEIAGLTSLMEATENAQAALNTEVQEIMLRDRTEREPDEERTGRAVTALMDAAKSVGISAIGIADDTRGKQATELLTNGEEQLVKARETAYTGVPVGQAYVSFDTLIEDTWTIQEAAAPSLRELDPEIGETATLFVETYRNFPPQVIDPTGKSPNTRKPMLDEMTDPANSKASSARLVAYSTAGGAGVLALVAIVLWATVLRRKSTKAHDDGAPVPPEKPAKKAKAPAGPVAPAPVAPGPVAPGPAAPGPAATQKKPVVEPGPKAPGGPAAPAAPSGQPIAIRPPAPGAGAPGIRPPATTPGRPAVAPPATGRPPLTRPGAPPAIRPPLSGTGGPPSSEAGSTTPPLAPWPKKPPTA